MDRRAPRKIRFKLLSFLAAFLFLCLAHSAYGITPITIDGYISDWAGIEPAFRDRINDQNSAADFDGTDIEEVYLARDDTFLYVMMKLYDGNPLMDPRTFYSFQANQSFDQADTLGDRLCFVSWFPSGWAVEIYERGEGTVWYIAHYEGPTYVAAGTKCIEWKVPLVDMGAVTGRFLRAYTHVVPVDQSSYPVSDENITSIEISFDQAGVFNGVGMITVQWSYIQNRIFEDGTSYNKLYFTLKDEVGQQIVGDLSPQVELYDPAGDPVAITSMTATGYDLWSILSGSYDGNTGKWSYDNAFWPDPAYAYSFSGTMMPGTYQLRITVDGYPVIIHNYDYPGPADLPVISASSFRAYLDASGNLVWRWDVPDFVDPAFPAYIRTNTTARVDGVNINNKLLHVKVPIQMGFVFVPKNVLDIFLDEGESLFLGICVRANNNASRTYSESIPLEAAVGPQAGWDINGDGQEGVPEAIHALQTAAGLRSAED